MRYKYPLARPYVGYEELQEIKKVFSSGWLTQGVYVEKFENEVAKYVKSKYAIAVTSCTAALYLCIKALNIKDGYVIAPDFTYPSTANVIIENRLKPLLLDVDENCRLSIHWFKDALLHYKHNIKAIILVHPFGHALNVFEYKKLLSEYGLSIPIIEDAATALGSINNGYYAGNMSEFGCFSFHPRKIITTGEGGMITLNDEDLYEKIITLREDGRNRKGDFVTTSLNFRMTDIQAAIGLVQLKKIEKKIDIRRKLAEMYHKLFNEMFPSIIPLKEEEKCRSTYQSYIIRLPRYFEKYQEYIIHTMREKYSIEVQIGTYALHMEPAFKQFIIYPLPMSELLRRTTFTLPLYEELTYEDLLYIVESFKKVCEELL
ncbi:MAG: DegT/DnrJ/EryC1/StrS family aminotransferase [Candidatus Methanomethylicia archaeon]